MTCQISEICVIIKQNTCYCTGMHAYSYKVRVAFRGPEI